MDSVFFIASKLVGLLLRPDLWILLCVGFVFISALRQKTRAACWSSGGLLCFLAVIGLFPIGDIVVAKLEGSFPPNPTTEEIHGIVVLGGSEDPQTSVYWEQIQLNSAAERLTAALQLAKRHPTSKLIVTGGSGKLQDVLGAEISEASIAEAFFLQQGIAKHRLLVEARSRNTNENARFSYDLASPAVGETWVLVTTAYHMPRAMRSFEASGWEKVVPWPVDYRTHAFSERIGWNLTRNLDHLNIAIKEAVGLLVYRLTSR